MPLTPNEIKEKLLGALDGNYNILNEDVVVEVIGILERFPITKEDLELTRIGKHVNELRRKTANQDLCRRSKNLVRSWQKLVLNDVSASSSPAASSPRLPPRPSSNALPGPRTSSPLVSVSGSPAGSQPRSPAGLHPRGSVAAMSVSTSPLVRTPASPAQHMKVVSTPVTHSGSRPVPPAGVPAVVALRGTSRLVSPATSSGEKAPTGAVATPYVGGKSVSSPAVPRQPVSASSSPALRPPAALPGASVPPPASPRLPSVPGMSRLESATAANYSRTATPPSISSGLKQGSIDKPGANRSTASLHGSTVVQKPAQKADAITAQRNGNASDGRLRMTPYAGAASVSPAASTHSVGTAQSVGTPLRPSHHYQSGDSHTPCAAGSKHPASDRANGELTVERTAVSKTNAANKKRRRSDDSIGSSSTSSAPPRKLPLLNGDAGTATPGHASVASVKNMAAQERRPSKVKTTAQLIAELQASKGGDGLLKSDTITRIVSNQIEREKYVEHESVVPASAKPRPRKKPGVASAFTKPPDTPDSASLAKTKSEMVQKYLSSSLLATAGNGGEDSQMTFASSSPSTVGAPSFSAPDNVADHDVDEDEFIDIEGLDTASTPDGQRLSQATAALRPSSTGAAAAATDTPIKGRAAQTDDPYSLLPPLNVDEIVWSDDDDPFIGDNGLTASCDDSAIDRLHDAKWPGVNGVFADGQKQWHDWTETIVHGNETGSTLFILPYVDVGD